MYWVTNLCVIMLLLRSKNFIMKKIIIWILVLIVVGLGIWCLYAKFFSPIVINDGTYRLVAVNGVEYVGREPVVLEFNSGRIAAKACNVMRSDFYTFENRVLSASIDAATRMICGGQNEEIMVIEADLQNLVRNAVVRISGQRITLSNDSNVFVFEQFQN